MPTRRPTTHRHRYFLLTVLIGHASGAPLTVVHRASVRERVEQDWQQQERLKGRDCSSPEALVDLVRRGRRLMAAMRALGAEEDALLCEHRIHQQTEGTVAASADQRCESYHKIRWAIRELAFTTPSLDFDEILFVRRQWPRWAHQCSHHVGEAQEPGADLCVLSGLGPDGTVTSLLGDRLPPGGIGRPDLSFDAKRVVFPYAASRTPPTPYGYGKPGVRGGKCLMYDIYEIDLDSGTVPPRTTALRRLTNLPDSEDTEPCYLPDGRIAFTSSRDGRFVQCGDWALVLSLFSMANDGSDVRKITQAKEGEWYPSVLDDGRIVYMRWEYVMKAFNTIQYLWTVYPDGRHAQLAYGDHFAFTRGPLSFIEARQIAGTTKVVCTGAAHHNAGVGPICVVDLSHNRAGPEGFVNLTPAVGYPEAGSSNTQSNPGWYSSPWPLSDDFFLVCYSYGPAHNVSNGYGLYLLDRFGNRELIYRDPDMSCYSPIPLRRRQRPRQIPAEPRTDTDTGTLFLADVYRGIPDVEPGTVKYLRVLETVPKDVHAVPQRMDLGVACGWDPRKVLGTVPIEADGSACFRVPADTPLFFEALDADFQEIRRMRSFLSVRPGENLSCVGCHEQPSETPSTRLGPFSNITVRDIEPPPWGQDAMDFRRVVQPVIDRHCIRCHDGSKRQDAAFDLRGSRLIAAPGPQGPDQGPQHKVSDSFAALLKFVNYVQVGGYAGGNLPLDAYATGSARSKLMQVLKQGHRDVKLTRDEWRAFAAWIDCNAPFYGGWSDAEVAEQAPNHHRLVRTPQQQTDSRQRRAELDKRAPEGARLVNYLDCGPETDDCPEGGPRLSLKSGYAWLYHDGDKPVHPRHAAIAFHTRQVVFGVAGLSPQKTYTAGIVWWDYNDVGRTQRIVGTCATGKRRSVLLPDRLLPGWQKRKLLPEEHLLPIPPTLYEDGQLKLVIENRGPANAVISELWLWEK